MYVAYECVTNDGALVEGDWPSCGAPDGWQMLGADKAVPSNTLQSSTLTASFDPSFVDPSTAAAFLGAGMLVVVPIWAVMFGGRLLVSAIKRG